MNEFERGEKAGRIDALLEAHTDHLAAINGSIDRFADSNIELASEIRSVQEQLRLAAERVVVAATTLATETERRRSELADANTDTDRTFTRRHALAGLALALLAVIVTYYVAPGN